MLIRSCQNIQQYSSNLQGFRYRNIGTSLGYLLVCFHRCLPTIKITGKCWIHHQWIQRHARILQNLCTELNRFRPCFPSVLGVLLCLGGLNLQRNSQTKRQRGPQYLRRKYSKLQEQVFLSTLLMMATIGLSRLSPYSHQLQIDQELLHSKGQRKRFYNLHSRLCGTSLLSVHRFQVLFPSVLLSYLFLCRPKKMLVMLGSQHSSYLTMVRCIKLVSKSRHRHHYQTWSFVNWCSNHKILLRV